MVIVDDFDCARVLELIIWGVCTNIYCILLLGNDSLPGVKKPIKRLACQMALVINRYSRIPWQVP